MIVGRTKVALLFRKKAVNQRRLSRSRCKARRSRASRSSLSRKGGNVLLDALSLTRMECLFEVAPFKWGNPPSSRMMSKTPSQLTKRFNDRHAFAIAARRGTNSSFPCTLSTSLLFFLSACVSFFVRVLEDSRKISIDEHEIQEISPSDFSKVW